MAKQWLRKLFETKLDQLWRRRTEGIRVLVIPRGVGQPTKFSKVIREKLIDELLAVATKILVREEGKRLFDDLKSTQKKNRRLKHFRAGKRNRAQELLSFVRPLPRGPVIYAFWKGSRCLYVGKGQTASRLKGYQDRKLLFDSTSLEVFHISTLARLPKAECLAMHLFNPKNNKVRSAKVKWGKRCPICSKHDKIRSELKSLFKMK